MTTGEARQAYNDYESYTDLQPVYSLYKEQREAIRRWKHAHDRSKRMVSGELRADDSFAATFTSKFTETHPGTKVAVQSSCGEEADFSDYDNW